jgi:hypothetical protein
MDTMRDIERNLKANDAKINKDIPNDEDDKDVFTEIKVQPKNTGVSSKIKKLGITLGKYNLSGNEIGSKYPWVYAQEKLNPTTKKNAEYFFNKLNITPTKISIGLVYRGSLSDEEFNNLSDIEKINKLEIEYKAKSFYIEGNYKGTPIIIARKETRSPMAGQTYLVSPYTKLKFNHIKDLPANEILAALKIPNDGNVDEIKVQPGNTGTTPPLTPEEKEWIKKQLMGFDPGHTPEGNPDEPLIYTFIDRDNIEDDIENEYMTSKDLELFDSIYRKLKGRIYTLNIGSNDQVDDYPQLRDSVVKSEDGPGLTVTWSDWDDDGNLFGAFDKTTGKYIKYSDL